MNNQEEKIPGLEINSNTGLYQIRENRVTYNFQQEMMISLENYLSKVEVNENIPLINSWYKSLPRYERQNIIINGGLEI
ncbi:MAG: hypothetical protein ABIO55_06635 [Ginsengibacter sp.]